MNKKDEVITFLQGLKTDHDEYYASISEKYPFRKDLLTIKTFNLFQPERLSEMDSKE